MKTRRILLRRWYGVPSLKTFARLVVRSKGIDRQLERAAAEWLKNKRASRAQ